MRLSIYVLFYTGAMLSTGTLVTCQTLKDALNLPLVAQDFLNSKIGLDSVTVTLHEMLGRINPQHQSKNLIMLDDCRKNVEMFSMLVGYLFKRQDGTHPRRIFYESTVAIWRGEEGRISYGFDYLKKSISTDKKEGLPQQPIMKALELRTSVEEYIGSGIKYSVAAVKLSELLRWIYPKYFKGNTKADIVTLSFKCSNIDGDHPELCRNGTHAQRIANESMAAFLQYYQGETDKARNILKASILNDDDFEITEELNVWFKTQEWGPRRPIEPEQNLPIEPSSP
jgi:hypothetical protein